MRRSEYNGSLEVAIEPQALAEALSSAALEVKAGDVVILDLRELVDYTDLFVLCTARNPRHVQAIAEEVRRVAKHELAIPCAGVEGLPTARWVLVDFEAVVVHVFDQPMRGFYNLDGLWAEAPRLEGPGAAQDDGDTLQFPEPYGV